METLSPGGEQPVRSDGAMRPALRTHQPPWTKEQFWWTFALVSVAGLLAAVVFGPVRDLSWGTGGGISQGSFLKVSSPTKASWHPNSSTYCGALQSLQQNMSQELSDGFLSQFWAASAANAAPDAATHQAALTVYSDVTRGRPTTHDDLNALVVAFPCPSG
jgi:hypothetical protein